MTTTETTAKGLDAWAMACSILVAMRKAAAKAQQEYDEAYAAGEGRPFSPGLSKAIATKTTLTDTARVLEHGLGQVARANNLEMPK